MTMKLTFLGTSGAVPSAKRNHTAVLLQFNQENILFDCGEGTQRQFRKAKLNPCRVTRILISHWHGDHVLGIPGLLQTLALSEYKKTLYIYGPKGTKRFMNNLLKTFVFKEKFKINVQEVTGKFLETKDFYLEAESTTHGTPSNAYCFVKKGNLRIDKKKLQKSKLPQGPLIKNIKQGKDVSYKGKKYKAKNLTYKEPERKICVVMDTSFNDKIAKFAKDSDILISEATFASDSAKKAKAKKLILTHFSQRYDKNSKIILDGAKKIFKNSEAVKDLDKIEI